MVGVGAEVVRHGDATDATRVSACVWVWTLSTVDRENVKGREMIYQLQRTAG